MKISQILLSTFFLSILGVISCKNPCSGVDCGNGECDSENGKAFCICNQGYEGDHCESRSVTKFLGNFNGSESCNSGSTTYAVEIADNPAANDQVTIENLYSSGLTVDASVQLDTLRIETQSFGNGSISGNGIFNSDGSISLSFSVLAAGQSDPCNLTLVPN